MEQSGKNKEEFLTILLNQVRCKKAHPFIEEEIKGHIEEQIEDNLLLGMSKEEAEQMAIKDMGSPVETGIALDRIHKPKTEWSMIVLMAVISLIGIVIHYSIVKKLKLRIIGGEYAVYPAIMAGSDNFAMYTILGFVVMLVVYHIDYTTIAKYAKIEAVAFLTMAFGCYIGIFGRMVNGNTFWFIGFENTRVSFFSFMMLYVPLYGAIIYKYYGTGYRGLIRSVLWFIAPIFIVMMKKHIILAGILCVALGVVLSLAIWNNWFALKNSSNKKILIGLWGSIIGLPMIGLGAIFSFGWLADYQRDRILAFLTNSGEANYLTQLIRTYLSNSVFLGNSGIQLAIEDIPDFNSSWILVYLSSTYGILVAVFVCCMLAILIIKVFSVSLKQKNQLGMVMGCGCGIVFFIHFILNILENIGLFPPTQTFLPFFSVGGSDIVVCYILMGIVLSIYRYKSIYPKHVSTKVKPLKIEIPL